MKYPTCDMEEGCNSPVTHIGSKGYVYCTEHAIDRRQSGYEHTRQMRTWELHMIQKGEALPSYRPLRREVSNGQAKD